MTKVCVFTALIALICAFSYTYAEEAVELEKGQEAPFTGFLLTRAQMEKVVDGCSDDSDKGTIIKLQKDVIKAYEKKDGAVEDLRTALDDMSDILDIYKRKLNDVIELSVNPKMFKPRYGLYAGAGQSFGYSEQGNTFYHVGMFISLGR